MRNLLTSAAVTGALVAGLALLAAPASAEDLTPVPSKSVCSGTYACMSVNRTSAPAGATVTFTGKLSGDAMKALKSWTRGSNTVCLERFKPAPEKDGSWPWTTMEGACSPVRKSGEFTIKAEFGRVGTYIYGLEFGPCRSNADECGNADPGLIGAINAGNKSLMVETTP